MVSPLSQVAADLERSEIMKMLAEQLIRVGRIDEGIDVTKTALKIQ